MQLSKTLSECPVCFRNFFEYARSKDPLCRDQIILVQSILDKELYHAKLKIIPYDANIIWTNYLCVLEFMFDEDYVSFILKWS